MERQLKWIRKLSLICAVTCFMGNRRSTIRRKELGSMRMGRANLFSNAFKMRLVDLNINICIFYVSLVDVGWSPDFVCRIPADLGLSSYISMGFNISKWTDKLMPIYFEALSFGKFLRSRICCNSFVKHFQNVVYIFVSMGNMEPAMVYSC